MELIGFFLKGLLMFIGICMALSVISIVVGSIEIFFLSGDFRKSTKKTEGTEEEDSEAEED